MKNLSNGFYVELNALREQGLTEASFGFMENIAVGEYFNLYDFLHGHCDEFAAGLSDYYDYPVEYILDTSNVLVHAYCTTEVAGIKAYIDARGITTDSHLFFDEFRDFCTYEEKTGRFYDLKGECQVLRHANTCEMYGDDNREPNQDKDLVEFFKDNNSYYDVRVFEREKFSMKTLKDLFLDKKDYVLEIVINDDYYLFCEGLSELGCTLSHEKFNVNKIKNLCLELIEISTGEINESISLCDLDINITDTLESIKGKVRTQLEPKNVQLSDVPIETLRKMQEEAFSAYYAEATKPCGDWTPGMKFDKLEKATQRLNNINDELERRTASNESLTDQIKKADAVRETKTDNRHEKQVEKER